MSECDPTEDREGDRMNLCTACGIAASHNKQGGPCLACYRAGHAALRPADNARRQVRGLLAGGWTRADIAAEVGVSRQAVSLIASGVTLQIRAGTADALEALVAVADDPPRCTRCDDIDTARVTSSDPRTVAARLGATPAALSRHGYRCGRPEVGRFFATAVTAERWAVSHA